MPAAARLGLKLEPGGGNSVFITVTYARTQPLGSSPTVSQNLHLQEAGVWWRARNQTWASHCETLVSELPGEVPAYTISPPSPNSVHVGFCSIGRQNRSYPANARNCWGWAKTETECLKLNPCPLQWWQESSGLSHPCCLPGAALAGIWRQVFKI